MRVHGDSGYATWGLCLVHGYTAIRCLIKVKIIYMVYAVFTVLSFGCYTGLRRVYGDFIGCGVRLQSQKAFGV